MSKGMRRTPVYLADQLVRVPRFFPNLFSPIVISVDDDFRLWFPPALLDTFGVEPADARL